MGIYSSKAYKNVITQKKAKLIADEMESSTAIGVSYCVQKLSGVVANLHKLLSPVVGVAFDMQSDHGDVNLQQVQTSSSGL